MPLKLIYHDTGHSLDRGLEWIAKSTWNGRLLVTVNADPNPLDVTIQGLPAKSGVEPVHCDDTVRIKAESLRVQLAPFETRLFRLVKQ